MAFRLTHTIYCGLRCVNIPIPQAPETPEKTNEEGVYILCGFSLNPYQIVWFTVYKYPLPILLAKNL